MAVHIPPRKQQGQYRYDPTQDPGGPARLFPYAGDDGILRYVLSRLRQDPVVQGRVSQPWSLMLQQLAQFHQTVEEGWNYVATCLMSAGVLRPEWLNVTLPEAEPFGVTFVQMRREMMDALLAGKKAAESALKATRGNGDERERAYEVRSQFYRALEQHQRSRPLMEHIHQRDAGLSDREFARQRLAGSNPMAIRRLQSQDQALLNHWSTAACQTANGESVDMAQAMTEQRLFVADYPLLAELSFADLQPGRYVGSPIALFYRAGEVLEPLLIQLDHGQLLTPTGSASDAWMRAKLYVQVADVTEHELITHLCHTHLAMEAFAIATPRQLPINHPLYRLLRPHFQYLLAINTRGNAILLGDNAAIETLMAPTRETSLALINRAYRDRPFQDYALPNHIERRGVGAEVLPDFPYRDDGWLVWEAISRYVTNYLKRYYADDSTVLQDPYLQAWAGELGDPLMTRPPSEFPTAPSWMPPDWSAQAGLTITNLPEHSRVPGFPGSGQLTSLQQLIDIVTTIIFTCGPQHAAVNFSQFDYVGYAPNAPLAAYSAPDVAQSVTDMLPSAAQELGQIALTFALSGICWGQLGSTELMQFTDAADQQVLARFQAELREIEQTMVVRDQHRQAQTGIGYPYLMPSRIPNSINI